MQRRRSAFLILFWLIVGVIVGCESPSDVQDASQGTLSSLKKVDAFPLYEMRFIGNYGFREFLTTGIQRTNYDAAQAPANKPEPDWACTCFAGLPSDGDKIFGRNFDWYTHPALLLFTNPHDGFASVSMVDLYYLGFSLENPPTNSSERLLEAPFSPFDGMNDQGLCVGIMAVPQADGGTNPEKITIGSLHAVRLVLDYAKDVAQAIELLQDYNIDFTGGPPVHYLISDAGGNSVVVEYIADELKTIYSNQPWQVATNFLLFNTTLDAQLAACSRYKKAYETLQAKNGLITVSDALSLLHDVSQTSTIWSTVYHATAQQIYIVMGKNYLTVHEFELD